MHDTLQSPQEPMERPVPAKKTGCGCLLNALIGLSVVVATLALAAWLLLMHSSLPLRGVASMIEGVGSQSHLKVTGISGSLASGLQFNKMKWDDGEISDVRLRYSGIMDVIRRKQLILCEVYVGSALIDTNFQNDKPQAAESPKKSTPEGKPTDWPLRLLQIDRVSLNHLVIKDRASGVTLNIPKFDWTGFKAEKGSKVEFGNLDADSDYLTVKTTGPRSSRYQRRFEVGIMPKMHEGILKPIHIATELGLENGKLIFDLSALDETVRMTVGADGIGRLHAEGANLADFIAGPLPQNLMIDAEAGTPDASEPSIKVNGGSFQLGMKSFEIQPTPAEGPQDQAKASVLLAVSRDTDRQFRYEVSVSDAEHESFKPLLTSTPPMSPEDILATLFHGTAFSSLSLTDQAGVRRRIPWFSFSRPK